MDHETRQALLSLSLLMRKSKEKAEKLGPHDMIIDPPARLEGNIKDDMESWPDEVKALSKDYQRISQAAERRDVAKKSKDPRRVEYADIPPVTPLEPVPKKYMATASETLTIRELNSDPINFAAWKILQERNLAELPQEDEMYLLQLASAAADEFAEEEAESDLGQMLIADVSVKEQMLKNLRKLNRDWEDELNNLLDSGLTAASIDLLVEAWPFKEALATYNPPEDWTR